MLKNFYLPTGIFWAVIGVILQSQVAMAALSSKEIGQLAKNITVRILTPGSPGSGIIIGKNDNTYKVLTARHVVDSIKPGEESDLETFDGDLHVINTNNIQSFGQNWDLAVVEFATNKSYQQGDLGDSSSVVVGQNVYVSGFPIATAAMNVSTLNFTEGKLTAVSSRPFDDGYGLAYNNNTLPGMSGGAVLDEEGKVIGVHGKADVIETKETADPNIRIKSGNNLAIPINYYLGLAKEIDFDPNTRVTQEPTADDHYIQAAQKSQQKNYEGAVSSLNQAIALNPSYEDAYNNRGLAYFYLKKYNEAISDYNQAIAVNPLSGAAFNNRGTLYYLLKKPGEAKADHDLAILLSAAIGLTPTVFPGTTTYRPRVASGATFRSFAQGSNQGLSAFPHLQRHLQVIGDNDGVPLDKSEAYAYYNRAIAYLNLQRYPEARQNLQQAANLYRHQGSNNISQRIIDFMNQLPN